MCNYFKLAYIEVASYFTEHPTTTFGSKLCEQVEERLAFFESGEIPRKNIDVMKEAILEVEAERMEAEAVPWVEHLAVCEA